MNKVQKRLNYLRGEIEAERISSGEILELQSLTKHIDPSDMILKEWAGINQDSGTREMVTYKELMSFLGGTETKERAIEILLDILNTIYSVNDAVTDILEYNAKK